MLLRIFAVFVLLAAPILAKDLKIYLIDVEGGQSTLIVSPSGESMLIDAGWPGNEGRDAGRIVSAAHAAGVKKIDYLLVTHYHMDHVGGVPDLAKRIPVGTFVDHGETVEHGQSEDQIYKAYLETRAKAKHLEVGPGDSVPLAGVKVQVLSGAGKLITSSLAGGGAKNPLCGSDAKRDIDPSENARSVGTLITFGKFRALDLGDLTWNKEMELVCPENRVGPVDLYIVTHHGMNMSGSATAVHAFQPLVAIMDNGARKGGTPEAYQAIRSSPGLQDIWQLHYAVDGGDKNNAPEKFIANAQEKPDSGYAIEVTVRDDGTFTVRNPRNGFSKDYQSR